MKPWIANLSFIVVEVLMIVIAFIIGADAIECLMDGDFSGYVYEMQNLIGYASIIDILLIVMSVIYLAIKPLRTKFTIFWSVCNIIGVLLQFYLMYLK